MNSLEDISEFQIKNMPDTLCTFKHFSKFFNIPLPQLMEEAHAIRGSNGMLYYDIIRTSLNYRRTSRKKNPTLSYDYLVNLLDSSKSFDEAMKKAGAKNVRWFKLECLRHRYKNSNVLLYYRYLDLYQSVNNKNYIRKYTTDGELIKLAGKYTKEQLYEWIKSSKTFYELATKMGIRYYRNKNGLIVILRNYKSDYLKYCTLADECQIRYYNQHKSLCNKAYNKNIYNLELDAKELNKLIIKHKLTTNLARHLNVKHITLLNYLRTFDFIQGVSLYDRWLMMGYIPMGFINGCYITNRLVKKINTDRIELKCCRCGYDKRPPYGFGSYKICYKDGLPINSNPKNVTFYCLNCNNLEVSRRYGHEFTKSSVVIAEALDNIDEYFDTYIKPLVKKEYLPSNSD